MSEYTATIQWKTNVSPEDYIKRQYSRAHQWVFDGGVIVPGSPSPAVVPPPLSDLTSVDPEEAFVAALSSCHMLFFLELAAKKRFVIDSYQDDAVGILAKNAEGKMMMTKVTLRPKAIFIGDSQPTQQEINDIHHKAHDYCFIANSVKSEVSIEPIFT